MLTKLFKYIRGYEKTALLAPPAIYLTCAAADILRKYLLEKPLVKLLNPAFQKIQSARFTLQETTKTSKHWKQNLTVSMSFTRKWNSHFHISTTTSQQ